MGVSDGRPDRIPVQRVSIQVILVRCRVPLAVNWRVDSRRERSCVLGSVPKSACVALFILLGLLLLRAQAFGLLGQYAPQSLFFSVPSLHTPNKYTYTYRGWYFRKLVEKWNLMMFILVQKILNPCIVFFP